MSGSYGVGYPGSTYLLVHMTRGVFRFLANPPAVVRGRYGERQRERVGGGGGERDQYRKLVLIVLLLLPPCSRRGGLGANFVWGGLGRCSLRGPEGGGGEGARML